MNNLQQVTTSIDGLNQSAATLATLTLITHNGVASTSVSTLEFNQQQLPRHVNICNLPFRIGRDEKFSDLTLDTPSASRMISRKHCVIEYDYSSKKFVCIDQNSLNGTFINCERIGTKEIEDGDFIVFTGGSSYSIGQCLQIQRSNPMDISMMNTSYDKNYTSNDLSCCATVHNYTSIGAVSSIEEVLCKLPNTFVYKFNIIQHPTSNISQSKDSGTMMTTNNHILTHRLNLVDESKKRERTCQQDLMCDDVQETDFVSQHSIKKAKTCSGNTTCRSLEDLQQENTMLKQQIIQLQQSLQKAREHNAQSTDNTQHINSLLRNILESEFHCSICHCLLLHPTTLQCSHTFCATCIQQWLPKYPNCPICRKKMTKQPIRNISLQGVLEKLEMLLSEEDKKERREREAEILKKEEEDLNKLNALIQTAKNRGMKFLKIEDEWSDHDKKVFMAGLAKYSGVKAKQVYLDLTGLNLEVIAKLTGSMLQRVCNNLDISPLYKYKQSMVESVRNRSNNQQLLDVEGTRERLREFWRNELLINFSS